MFSALRFGRMSITVGTYPPSSVPPVISSAFDPDSVAQEDLAIAQFQAYQNNTGLIANYTGRFNQFLPLYKLGQLPASAAPTVPDGYVVSVTVAQDGNFNIALVRQGSPVCDALPLPSLGTQLPAPGAPNVIHVGKALGGNWWSCGQDDTFASGKTTPPVVADDGTPGMFEKFAAPVGNGWYLKVG